MILMRGRRARTMKKTETTYFSTFNADPYSYYENLLRGDAMQWDETLDAWLVSTYEGCKEVLRNDDRLFDMPERSNQYREELASVQGGMRAITLVKGEE